MKTLIAAFLMMAVMNTACPAAPEINRDKLPDEVRAAQVRDMKWGMFICWSFSTFSGREWTPTRGKDASFFKATGCDTDQWCQTARDAGMGYILFLTKHHDGFCLWDTKTTEKKVTNSPLGIDVLAELRKSCDKYGIKLALYFSEGDWNWPGAVDGKGGSTGGSNPGDEEGPAQGTANRLRPHRVLVDGPCGWHRRALAPGDRGMDASVPTEHVRRVQPRRAGGSPVPAGNGQARQAR